MHNADARFVVEHVNRKFTATDGRLERLDIRLARLEARLEALAIRISTTAEPRSALVDAGDATMIE